MRRKKRPVRRLKNNTGLRTTTDIRVERYNLGLKDGYKQGLEAGFESYDTYFEGTSIIIPSCNEVGLVKACIKGIMNHTDLPYEVIVIDNSSTDGIQHYLKQLDGQVRYRILEQNVGYTGAANIGFMMAKGTTILLLSSLVRPTENWLDNMLICLNSDTSIGMVGPVSNSLNGDQRLELHDKDMKDMHGFARRNNVSDAHKWKRTRLLSSSCLLFRRELLAQVGYMDEGFKEAAFREEDYCLRVRLQGYSLVYAGDAFVHQARKGNVAAASDEAESTGSESMSYFTDKWSNASAALNTIANKQHTRQLDPRKAKGDNERQLGEAVFYPQAIAVKGIGETAYWIENHVRRPIVGLWKGPIIQLSQIDIWRWTVDKEITAEEASNKQECIQKDAISSLRHSFACLKAGGRFYYLEYGKRRPIVSSLAADAWHLNKRPLVELTESELLAIPIGLPIIAPIQLRQAL